MLTVAFRARTSKALPTTAAVCARRYHHSLLESIPVSRRVWHPIRHPGPTFPRANFHCSSRQRSNKPSASPGPTSFRDPERPDLYYHLVGPPTPVSASQPAFALSFLPAQPKTTDARAIIGWLPAVLEQNGSMSQGQEEAGLNDFVENAKFREALHAAIRDGLREGVDEIQTNGAIQLQNGWMHIHDERNVPALGRIGDPDDILASVLVADGKILPETYQPMPAYRLCTQDGVTKLTPGLAAKLQSFLSSRDASSQD
ncbi:hypothetical protein AX14_011651 [Amanita brunnescens Koide BX004]|nr:hypothetical protein AX14_011651 [Amanita brunnescens Koide BX004]